MKIITLNTWSGMLRLLLLDFIMRHEDADVFCLQEVYRNAYDHVSESERQAYAHNLFDDVRELLPDHLGFFRPSIGDFYGLAIFVHKRNIIEAEGDIWIHRNANWVGGNDHSRNLQYVLVNSGQGKVLVANTHGMWSPLGKGDLPERLEQSHVISTFLNQWPSPKVLCGDLNLRPDTQSISYLGKDLRNLVAESGARSTRTSLYHKPERFADYIFVSRDIRVSRFVVLSDEVSDHSPLLVEFELSEVDRSG